ncbi:MAG: nitrile hydratase subunit alpha [Alphaproteobacteria bacterium]
MPHDHHSEHDHSPIENIDTSNSATAIMADALRELLIEKGYFTHDDVNETILDAEKRGLHLGAKLVAKAWIDSEFKDLLLKDGPAACAALGIDIKGSQLLVVENTPKVHNLIVCTLCSCYPVMLLGPSPEWYKSKAYRARSVWDPRGVLAEFGTNIGLDREVRVHDSTADMRYMVLPMRPASLDIQNEEQLTQIITLESLIGTREILY